MVNQKLIEQIQADFLPIWTERNILGVLLYGSHALGMETLRSDIDICVVAPGEDIMDLLSFIWQNVNVSLKKYDVRVFHELPLYIKIQVIEKGILIYSTDKYELYEFFFVYRKIWADQKFRNTLSKEELLSLKM